MVLPVVRSMVCEVSSPRFTGVDAVDLVDTAIGVACLGLAKARNNRGCVDLAPLCNGKAKRMKWLKNGGKKARLEAE